MDRNNIKMIDRENSESDCGQLAYENSHLQGVSDGILNGFNIIVMFSKLLEISIRLSRIKTCYLKIIFCAL